MNELTKSFKKVKELTEKQLSRPNQDVYRVLAHTLEELGEFSTAVCVEDKDITKSYKVLDETSKDEAIDVLICALSLYYSREGSTEDISVVMNKKLKKWEEKIGD